MAYSGGREAGAGCWNCSYSQTPQGATDPQAAMERGKQRHSAGRRVGADTSRPVCGCLSHQCRICSPGPKPIPVTLCTCALWAFPLRAQPPGPRLHQLWPLLWPRDTPGPPLPSLVSSEHRWTEVPLGAQRVWTWGSESMRNLSMLLYFRWDATAETTQGNRHRSW